jgi:subtilisin-like proprotein convertase family protein
VPQPRYRNVRRLIAVMGIVSAMGGAWWIFSDAEKPNRGDAANEEAELALQVDGKTYRLVMDRYVVKGLDGIEEVRPLPAGTTRASMANAIRRAGGEAQGFPILEELDASDRSVTRRLMTDLVTIRLPQGKPAEAVAKESGMELVEQPAYAPGYAVFRAADALAAHEISQRLIAEGRYPLVEHQLAKQQQLRALPNDTLFRDQWHLKFQSQADVVAGTDINVESLWNYGGTGLRGTGIRVGIVDDGLQTNHPDMTANVDTVNDFDWNGNDNNPSPGLFDDHGTACAGLVGARGNNNLGVAGSAPESTLVGLRLVGGASTDSTEASAMAHKNDLIFIKSNSWGPADDGATLEAPGPLTQAALQNAALTGRQGKGTIFVWAGGNGLEANDNSNYDGYANSIYTIAVGAMDSKMRQSFYSEPGANLHCVAPSNGDGSVGITTTDRTAFRGYDATDYTSEFGGTSAATPIAAGVIALMLQKNPQLGWRDVQEILLRSSTRILPNDAGWSTNAAGLRFHHSFGSGLVNAAAAVALAETWVNRSAPLAPVVSTQSGSFAIPDNSVAGVSRSFVIGSSMRIEHVTIKVSITHALRGQLAITLTSPSGMVSRLAEVHDDPNANYSNWTFSSVRHWGEQSQGTWILQVSDGVTDTPGTLTAAELTLHGAAAPMPQVTITSPSDQGFYLPAQAQSFQLQLTGNITKVELRQNGTVVATKTTPPFTFSHAPTTSPALYTATAYDTDLFSASSAPVTLTLATPFQEWISGYPLLSNKNPTADPDGDGFTNEQEFISRTDPSSAASALRMTTWEKNPAATSVTLTWQSVSGVSYQIEHATLLGTWSNLGAPVVANSASISATRAITPATSRFFRVRALP